MEKEQETRKIAEETKRTCKKNSLSNALNALYDARDIVVKLRNENEKENIYYEMADEITIIIQKYKNLYK